ncbi:hypothetical protein [Dactylosporangium sp. CA-139066]|uniref:hypothetical protein n=1 Tax=Dactylosporangium sp. CA-139066 TaxID=3239930 RepID=UPI003D8CC963
MDRRIGLALLRLLFRIGRANAGAPAAVLGADAYAEAGAVWRQYGDDPLARVVLHHLLELREQLSGAADPLAAPVLERMRSGRDAATPAAVRHLVALALGETTDPGDVDLVGLLTAGHSEREIRAALADLDGPAPEAELPAATLRVLGRNAMSGYRVSGDPAHLEQALAMLMRALMATPESDAAWRDVAVDLVEGLVSRFELTGGADELAMAVDVGRHVAQQGDERVLPALCDALRLCYEFGHGGPEALDEAVAAGERATGEAGAVNLALALLIRHQIAGAVEDLRRAAALLSAARDGCADPGRRAAIAGDLGVALQQVYRHEHDPRHLTDAIAATEEALTGTDRRDARLPGYVGNLGALLVTRYERAGAPADLEAGIGHLRDALSRLPAGHPDTDLVGANLAHALRLRAERGGRVDDADDAVATSAARPPRIGTHPGTADLHAANALHARYVQLGDVRDLHAAVQRMRRALAATPAGHVARPGYRATLGAHLQELHLRTDGIAPLDEAIDHLRAATAAEDNPQFWVNLSNALRLRWIAADDPGHDPAWLREAIDAATRALARTGPGHFAYPGALANLATAEYGMFQHSPRPEILERVIDHAAAALAALDDDHPDRSRIAIVLAEAYEQRDPSGLAAALATLRTATEHPTAPALIRCTTAMSWGDLAARHGRWEEATLAYAWAVRLLGPLTRPRIGRESQEYHLERFTGAATAGAAAALNGTPSGAGLVQALALLEQGRAILHTQAWTATHAPG